MDGISPDCARFDGDLSALLDGELAAGRAAEVRAHVSRCAHCEARLAAFGALDSALRGDGAPAPPADLRERIGRALAEEAPRGVALRARSRRRAAPLWGSALAAAAAAAVYLAFGDRPPPDAFEDVPEEALAVALEYDTIRDLELIAILELLEQLEALDALDGAGESG